MDRKVMIMGAIGAAIVAAIFSFFISRRNGKKP